MLCCRVTGRLPCCRGQSCADGVGSYSILSRIMSAPGSSMWERVMRSLEEADGMTWSVPASPLPSKQIFSPSVDRKAHEQFQVYDLPPPAKKPV